MSFRNFHAQQSITHSLITVDNVGADVLSVNCGRSHLLDGMEAFHEKLPIQGRVLELAHDLFRGLAVAVGILHVCQAELERRLSGPPYAF